MIDVKNMNRFISRMCMGVLNLRLNINICHIDNGDGTYWWYNPATGSTELIDEFTNTVIKKEGTLCDRILGVKDEILMHNVNSSCCYDGVERIIEEEHGYEKNKFFFLIPKEIIICLDAKPITFKKSLENFKGIAVPKYNEAKNNNIFKDDEGHVVKLRPGVKYTFYSIHNGRRVFIFLKTDNPKYDLMFRFDKSPWQFNHWMNVIGVDKG